MMYCDFCDRGGKVYSRREGASINEPPHTRKCTHCDGSGYEPNNHWGSLDEEWLNNKKNTVTICKKFFLGQLIMKDKPRWERGVNVYGYWLDQKRIGYIGKVQGEAKWFWSFDLPRDATITGETTTVRKAKKYVEGEYGMYLFNQKVKERK